MSFSPKEGRSGEEERLVWRFLVHRQLTGVNNYIVTIQLLWGHSSGNQEQRTNYLSSTV